MATFTIDSENNIAAHAGTPASAHNQQAFATEKELDKLAATWGGQRLIEVWNSFAGVRDVCGRMQRREDCRQTKRSRRLMSRSACLKRTSMVQSW
jgi:hypothetical protein